MSGRAEGLRRLENMTGEPVDDVADELHDLAVSGWSTHDIAMLLRAARDYDIARSLGWIAGMREAYESEVTREREARLERQRMGRLRRLRRAVRDAWSEARR